MTNKKKKSKAFATLRRMAGGHNAALQVILKVKQLWPSWPKGEAMLDLWAISKGHSSPGHLAQGILLELCAMKGSKVQEGKNPGQGWKRLFHYWNGSFHDAQEHTYWVQDTSYVPPAPVYKIIDGVEFTLNEYNACIQANNAWMLSRKF